MSKSAYRRHLPTVEHELRDESQNALVDVLDRRASRQGDFERLHTLVGVTTNDIIGQRWDAFAFRVRLC